MNIAGLCVAVVLGSILVLRMRIFRVEGTSPVLFLLLFWLKVLTGFVLYLIYTMHYTDRSVSDIFRYFDDAKVMYSALKESPADYLRMLTGIGADAPHLSAYYHQMSNWNLGKLYNFYNDNRTITRFNALLFLLSSGNFHIHTVVMCFLSLSGLTYLYRFFHAFTGPSGWIFSGIFLIPSVLFWSSGVLKEGLLMFALGGFLYYSVKPLFGKMRLWDVLVMLLFLLLLISVKVYVLFCLLPAVLALWWTGPQGRGAVWKFPVVYLLLISTGYFAIKAGTERDPLVVISEKQNDFWLLARGGAYVVDLETSDTLYIPLDGEKLVPFRKNGDSTSSPLSPVSAFLWKNKREGAVVTCFPQRQYHELLRLTYTGSRIGTSRLEPEWTSFFLHAPGALFSVLARPLPWEYSGFLSGIAMLENLTVFLFLIYAIRAGRNRDVPAYARPVNSLFFFCFFFFLSLALLIGLTTPVTGAIVRYKTPLLPFLIAQGALFLHFGSRILRNKM
ncbi:MAG: hypothetical protein IT233_04345 [Bacteroidia bacterium]|nr:hypothetical protein [Bacteroidia bacterium]